MAHFTARDGARLYYRDEGAGPAVLCLPGLTRTGADFDYMAEHLPGVRLILPDYRGRGRSAWTGAATYTVPQEAQDALALLDHLGLTRVPVIGTSRGGLIGMFLAATAKDRLAGLLLNDVGPVLEREGLEVIFDFVGRDPKYRSHAEMADAMPTLMPEFGPVPEGRWLEDVRRHFDETPQGLKINYDPTLREAFLAAFAGPEPDLWPLFDALDGLPVALIRGASSRLLSAQAAADMRRRRPDMIFAEVPGRGHIPFLDEPESLAAIRAFLKAAA